MSARTGIEPIDRIDALLDDDDVDPMEKVDQTSRAYPELRDIVLRLQREKDEEQQRVEYLCEEVTRLKEERDTWRGQGNDWKRWCEEAEDARDAAEAQRDRYAKALRAVMAVNEYHYGPDGDYHDNEVEQADCELCVAYAAAYAVMETEGRDG